MRIKEKQCVEFLQQLSDMWLGTNSGAIERIVAKAEKLRKELIDSPKKGLFAKDVFEFLEQFLAERWHSSYAWNWEQQAINHYAKHAKELLKNINNIEPLVAAPIESGVKDAS